MFGYVMVNKPELKFREFDRYKSYYCGLCRALKERYGLWGRLTLNYDTTFLVMLLQDLYDPKEACCEKRCGVHPCRKHTERTSEISEYSADMCVILAYYKCLDDWKDERKFFAKLYSGFLCKKVERNSKLYGGKAVKIASLMEKQGEIEEKLSEKIDSGSTDIYAIIEEASSVFAEIMGTVFSFKEDFWAEDLYKMGSSLGRFIYILDAYEDLEKDIKSGSFNPFKNANRDREFDRIVYDVLYKNISEAADIMEALPLVENLEILRNIIYSGVWTRYNAASENRE